VVISDYRHGLLPENLVKPLLQKAHATGKPVYVDSQVSQNASNHKLYRGNCIICLNLKEARCIDPSFEPTDDLAAFAVLNRELDTDCLIIKLGDEGALFQHGSRIVRAPAKKVSVVDTTGAGDAFLSAFCLAGIEDPPMSLKLANAWAGLAVQIHGTTPPKKNDLLAAVAG
jgi:sugar/nucleoside kinase (ribokinase family)